MDFITVDGEKLPFLNVLNKLTDQSLHWTEMAQIAPVYLTSFLRQFGIAARFSIFSQCSRLLSIQIFTHSWIRSVQGA